MSRRVLAGLLCAAVLTASCGSMLTEEELLAADGLGGGGGGGTGSALRQGGADGTEWEIDPETGEPVDLEDLAALDGAFDAGDGPAGNGGGPGGGPTAGGGGDVGAGGGDGAAGGGGGGGGNGPAGPQGGNGGATDVGVTGDAIRVGLVTTLTGPVPGLFRGAAVGAQACAARTNAQGGIHGRRLDVEVADDQANENQTRAQAERLSSRVLAFVGSFTLFDGSIAVTAEEHGVPDIGTALQPRRSESRMNWSPQPTPPGWHTGGLAQLRKKFPEASQAVGFLGADLAETQNRGIIKVLEHLGFKVVYDQRYSATTQDFTAHVFRMRTAGVRWLIVTGEAATYAQILQNADQQDLDLDVFNPISNAYDKRYLDLAGNLAEGTVIYATHVMFAGEDARAVPEVSEFTTWMSRIDARAVPDVFALYGWASCLIFVDAAQEIGPDLTRDRLREKLTAVTDFDANGLLAPTNPAKKEPPTCYVLLEVRGGRWHRFDTPPDQFRCDGGFLRL